MKHSPFKLTCISVVVSVCTGIGVYHLTQEASFFGVLAMAIAVYCVVLPVLILLAEIEYNTRKEPL